VVKIFSGAAVVREMTIWAGAPGTSSISSFFHVSFTHDHNMSKNTQIADALPNIKAIGYIFFVKIRETVQTMCFGYQAHSLGTKQYHTQK
jgi:hypothetical protein